MKTTKWVFPVQTTAFVCVSIILMFGVLFPIFAATITVTNTNDNGTGSLRQAIIDAASGDVIEFDPGVAGIITLTGQLTINKNLTINGPGADVLAISGNNAYRVILITSGFYTVTISGLTISDGYVDGGSFTGEGGGINNLSAQLTTINNCHIHNNTVEGNSARGGGINHRGGSDGLMILNNCRVEGNTTRSKGGLGTTSEGAGVITVGVGSTFSHTEIYGSTISGNMAIKNLSSSSANGGGYRSSGNATTIIENSTISDNSAANNGGGISIGATATFNFLTITNNTAVNGGGISGSISTGGIKNSIIAGNTSTGSGPDYSGTLNSQGYNLIGNTSGATITGNLMGNILNESAGLVSLADNGGATSTHALLPNSPALNAGSCDGVTTDQRGFSRPQDGQCDIGAFENQAPLAICQNVTVTAGANCTADASIDNGSNDPDGDPVTVVLDPVGPYNIGMTAVTLTVTDDKGASTQCNATVTVLDDIEPEITCPGDITVAAVPGACDAVVNFSVTATDCDPNLNIECTPASGSTFAIGTTVVNCTATDGSGNNASCSFNVTVTGGSGTIAGTVTENGNGVDGITVNLLDDQNPMTVIDSKTTDTQGNYDFTDIALATYQVMVEVPAGYTIDQNNVVSDLATCGATNTVDFVLTPTSSDGTISGTVKVGVNGLAGVKVALLDPMGVQAAGFDTLVTDGSGEYQFSDVPPGDYLVRLIEPLGYTAAENPVVVTLGSGEDETVDFVLEQTVIANNCKPAVWWEVQFLLNLLPFCNPEVSEQDLENYIILVQEHYTPHFDIFENDVTLADWWEKLRVWNNLTQYKRARRQLATLLMNMVSGRIGQYSIVTADGYTAGDVLTYVSELLTDPYSGSTDYLTAELLAAQVNLRRTIAANKVHPSTSILYKNGNGPDWSFGQNLPEVYALEQNFPNPFNPRTTISFALPEAGKISLNIYNVQGQLVRTLVSGSYEAGIYNLQWDATNDYGVRVGSGIYFYRIQAENYVETRKMTLLR